MEAGGELAKYGAVGIAIALVGVMTLVIRAFIKQMEETRSDRREQDKELILTQKELRKAIDKNSKCTQKNTLVANETYKFLKTLNGDLKAVVHKKAKGN